MINQKSVPEEQEAFEGWAVPTFAEMRTKDRYWAGFAANAESLCRAAWHASAAHTEAKYEAECAEVRELVAELRDFVAARSDTLYARKLFLRVQAWLDAHPAEEGATA